MGRMEQVNELLMSELSYLISQEKPLDNGLITIINVKCSPNLKSATINISVLPENVSGTALKELRKMSSVFSAKMRKKLNLKTIPRFNWQIDSQERHALQVDKAINEIRNSQE